MRSCQGDKPASDRFSESLSTVTTHTKTFSHPMLLMFSLVSDLPLHRTDGKSGPPLKTKRHQKSPFPVLASRYWTTNHKILAALDSHFHVTARSPSPNSKGRGAPDEDKAELSLLYTNILCIGGTQTQVPLWNQPSEKYWIHASHYF